MKVYVLSLQTESGDEYSWVLDAYPDEEQVFNIFKRDIPYELDSDPEIDRWGTAKSWRIEKVEVESLKWMMGKTRINT